MSGLTLPRRPPLFSTASASTPANCGDEELVPMSNAGLPPIQTMAALRGRFKQSCALRSASPGQPPIMRERSGTERDFLLPVLVRSGDSGVPQIMVEMAPEPQAWFDGDFFFFGRIEDA